MKTGESIQQTGSSGVDDATMPVQTESSVLTQQYGWLRDETTVLNEEVGDGHRKAQSVTLDDIAHQYALQSVDDLLDRLSRGFGLSWNDIALVVGVSVQSLRKWRQGEACSGKHRLAVARLVAAVSMLEGSLVNDVPGWLEVPVMEGYSRRHIDLLADGRADLLFDLAGSRITPTQALDEWIPDWRTSIRREHEVFVADDGELSIRRRPG